MEESEKRKEWLRTMRMEASEAGGLPNSQSPEPAGVLANPLIETSTVQDSCAIPRFDYYTDPMSAYSGNKRQSNLGQSPRDYPTSHGGGRGSPMMQFPPSPLGPRNPEMTPRAHQARANFISNQRMHQGGNPHYYGSGPIRSPIETINPRPEHQGHGFLNQSGSASCYYPPGNSSEGYNTPRPGFQWARAGSPSFGSPHGRGNWVNSSSIPYPGSRGSPFPNPGRGRSRGHWANNSMTPGRSGNVSGGRGIGYQGDTPPIFYRKFMVEDPWRDLKPVVWRGLNSTKSAELFQKFSSGVKKPRVAEGYNVSKSKESLADYLAAAFDEAVGEGSAS